MAEKEKKNRLKKTDSLRSRAEEVALEKSSQTPENLDKLPPERVKKLLHELRVKQIELEMQNEELRWAHKELGTSRARYFDLYDLAPVGYLSLNEKGFILEANLTAAEMLGTSRNALSKQPLSRFILPEDQPVYLQYRKQLVESGISEACDVRMLKQDEEPFWAQIDAIFTQDAGGEPVYRVVLNDITEAKETGEALKSSEARFHSLFDNMAEGVALHEVVFEGGKAVNYRIVDVNHSFTRITGITRGMAIGKLATDIRGTKEPPYAKEFIGVALGKEPYSFETCFTPMDKHFAISVVPWGTNGFATIFTDVTERKKAEEALKESERRFRSIFNSTFQFVGLMTPDGTLKEANQTALHFAGIRLEDVANRPFWETYWWRGNEARVLQLKDAIVQAAHGRFVRYEVELQGRGNSVGTFDFSLKPIFDADGEVILLLPEARDITEKKRAEEALKISEKKLEEAQKMAHLGYWHWDVRTGNVEWSEEVYRIFRLDPKEFTPHIDSVLALSPWSEDHERDKELIKKAVESHEPGSYEQKFLRPDKSIGYYYSTFQGIYGPRSELVSIVGTVQDITERKEAEHRQKFLTEVLGILNEPSNVADAILWVLTAIKKETGFEAVGIRLKNGDDYPYFVQEGFSDDFLVTENTLTVRDGKGGLCRNKNGNPCLECTCGLVISGKADPSNPLFTPSGSFWTNDSLPILELPSDKDPRLHPRNKCIHEGYRSIALVPIRAGLEIVGLLQLNDRKKDRLNLDMIHFYEGLCSSIGLGLMRRVAEDALKESEKKYKSIFESAAEGILIADKKTRSFKYANSKICSMFGYNADEFVGLSVKDIHPPEHLPDVIAAFESLARGEITSASPILCLRKDGTVFISEINATNVMIDGTPCSVGFFTDITERKRAEDALRINEGRYREAQAMGHVGNWEYNLQTSHFWGSDEAKRIYGFDPEQAGFSTDEVESCIPERERVHQALVDLIETDKPYNLEFEIHPRNSSETRTIASIAELQRDEHGQPLKVVGVIHDVTKRKEAEKDIARAGRALRMLSDSNQTLLRITDETALLNEICRIVVDEGGYLMAWVGFAENDEAKTLRPVAHAGIDSGYIESAKVSWGDNERGRGPGGTAIRTGKPYIVRNVREDPAFEPWREAAIQRGYNSIIVLPLISEDRTLGALGIYSNMIDSFDGKEVKILQELAGDLAFGILALHTRAERKQAEKLLRESEERFHELFELAPLGYQSLDADGHFIEVNQTWLETLGYSREEVVGKWFGDFLAPEFVDAFRERFPKFKALGKIHSEFQMLHKDGSRRFIAFEGRIGYQQDGIFKRTHCILSDITDRKKMEEEKESLLKNLVQSEKMAAMGQMAAGIAHEINNPMTVIFGFAQQLVRKVKPGDAFEQAVKAIERESLRCKNLIDTLLAFSRVSPNDHAPTNLNSMVEKTIPILVAQSRMVKVEIKKELADGLPEIMANANQVQQIIVNLANNAFDAMSDGGTLTLRTELLREGDRAWACLKVADTGSGIPAEMLPRIFEPFFTTKREGKGTGLGLSLVSDMVKKNSGTITVQSRPGFTEFTVKFESRNRHTQS